MHLILEGIYWENYEQTGFRQIYLAKEELMERN